MNAGRLEYYYDGQWGTVCDDSFDRDQNAARVACRTLGLPSSDAQEYNAEPGEGATWLDQVSCEGNENNLLDCSMNDIGNEDCSHSEDVGVICQGEFESGSGGSVGETIDAGDFRLVLNDEEQIYERDYTRVSGRLEYRYEGTWGTVCDDAFDNNNNGA